MPVKWRGRKISVSDVSTTEQKISETRGFYLLLLIPVVNHWWLADLQRVIWPDSLKSHLVARRRYNFFSHFFLLSHFIEISLPCIFPISIFFKQLHGHRPSISKTIQIIPSRHVGHCWRKKDELVSNFLIWIPSQ